MTKKIIMVILGLIFGSNMYSSQIAYTVADLGASGAKWMLYMGTLNFGYTALKSFIVAATLPDFFKKGFREKLSSKLITHAIVNAFLSYGSLRLARAIDYQRNKMKERMSEEQRKAMQGHE